MTQQRLVVIGNGMVGQKYLEYLVASGLHHRYQVTVLCAEPRPAYDRVHLSSVFDGTDPDDLPRPHRQADVCQAPSREPLDLEHGAVLVQHTARGPERVREAAQVAFLRSGQHVGHDGCRRRAGGAQGIMQARPHPPFHGAQHAVQRMAAARHVLGRGPDVDLDGAALLAADPSVGATIDGGVIRLKNAASWESTIRSAYPCSSSCRSVASRWSSGATCVIPNRSKPR